MIRRHTVKGHTGPVVITTETKDSMPAQPHNDNPPHRPPVYDEAMKRKQIHLPDEMIEFARSKGHGTLAEGVRACIAEAMDRDNG